MSSEVAVAEFSQDLNQRIKTLNNSTLKLQKLVVLHDNKSSEVSFLMTTLELRMSLMSQGVVIVA